MDFITISGWCFGLLSLIFGIVQMMQKNKCKRQLKQEQNIEGNSTGYQSRRDININEFKTK